MTFTYMNWKLAEIIIERSDFNFTDLYITQCIEMSYCLYPFYRTILHKMLQSPQNLEELFCMSKRKINLDNNIILENGFEFPFFKDLADNTILHYAVKYKNKQVLSLILNNLKDASIDHHDRLIMDLIPKIIKSNLSICGEYLDKRISTY